MKLLISAAMFRNFMHRKGEFILVKMIIVLKKLLVK